MSEDQPPLVSPSKEGEVTSIGDEVGVGGVTISPNTEFPLTHFRELESCVHTDQWSIPYKRDESLAICMVATIKTIKEGPGLAEGDENCKKFIEKTMYDSFQKLVTHDAVLRWDQSIMEGIYDMLRILMELIAERLKQPPIPLILLDLLAMVFNDNANFHVKTRNKRSDPGRWKRVLGEDGIFAQMPHFHSHKYPKGWLVDILNIFAQHGGVDAIRDVIENTKNITLQELTALFQPFSVCEGSINPAYLKVMLSKSIYQTVKFIHDLTDDSLKNKEVGCVSDLLKSLKTLLLRCNLLNVVTTIDNIRLEITTRMLHIAHFNAKMNALKEVVRLTDEPYQAATYGIRNPIPADKIADWLVEKKVFLIALGGNLHQSQYCDKLKSIVEFLGPKLSMEELTTIWEMQVDKNPVQVENVHGILAAAASRSGPTHLDHIFQLIQQSWESAPDRYREKLLELIGKIGKDNRQGKVATKILDLLWRLAHLPHLSRQMVELVLESHASILFDSTHTKETETKTYISKCVEDIKKGTWVVSVFRQLHRFAKGLFKTGYGQKDQQQQIAKFQKQYDLLRLTSNSLIKCHTRAVQECTQNGETLSGSALIDGQYTHSECMEIHLKFMAFLFQEGALYLPIKRAIEVWDTLISASDTCPADRTLAFKWFDTGMSDLEHETQVFMFNTRVLKVDPDKLDKPGYSCLRNFFETINLFEKKLKRMTTSYQSLLVENPELTGIKYIWRAALEVGDTGIANELIQFILQISYQGLSAKLKKDVALLHRRFIDECFKRLDELTSDDEKSGKAGKVNSALRLQAIERLLILAQRYITTVEESHHNPRTLPPHGATFLGPLLALTISTDQSSFKLDGHFNESLLSIKDKIAQKLNTTPEQLQIGTSERWLDPGDNNKLVHQLGFTDQERIIVKIHSTNMPESYSKVAEGGNEQRQALLCEMEQNLPGVIMATQTEIFSKLEHLCSLGSPEVIKAVRGLLMLIPTDSHITEVMEVFTHTPLEGAGATDSSDTPTTPQGVLSILFSPASTSLTQLLYNLEVLSSRLMPASHKADGTTTQIFRRTFLESGGLKSVINVLQKNTLPSDLDLVIQQGCYAIALSLARMGSCVLVSLMPQDLLHMKRELTTDNSRLSEDLQHMESRVQELTTDNSRLSEDLQHMESRAQELTTDNSRLSEDLQHMESRAQELTTDNSRLSEDLQHMESRAQELTTDNSRLSEDLQHMESRVQELTTDNSRLSEDLQHMEGRAQSAEQNLHDLETQWVVHRRDIRMTERELGGGGWGFVKVAKFRGIEVAAKSLYKQIRSDYYKHLFIREMNMAARLRHPNLVQFIGATLEREMIILTELMATSLRRVLEQGGVSREHIVSISVQVCQALNYLHLMRPDPVIHRDISSANVLLNPLPDNGWLAKVTDYGSVNTLQILKTENPGSPVYAAPEAKVSSLQSTKMDIFSVGVLLIEMCTGQLPSDDKREHLFYSIKDRPFTLLIKKCINGDKDKRPTASELIRKLHQE